MIYRLFFMISLLLAAASCTPAPAAEEAAAPVVGETTDASTLQIVLVSADFAVGEPRISFAVFDGDQAANDIESIRVSAVELGDDLAATDATPSWRGEATG